MVTLDRVIGVFGRNLERDARRWLAQLMEQVGAVGLAAAAAVPALSAMVDQHAAGVRDILLLGVEGSATAADAVLLAGYARGLLDEAGTDAGRLAAAVGDPSGPGWADADWLTLRVVAVCAMSRTDEWRRPVAGWLAGGSPA